MDKLEGHALWEMRVEISQKFSVREFEKTGCCISHWIGRARDVVMSRYVTMEALMYSVEAEQMGRGAVGACAALALPEHCGKIVGLIIQGSFSHIKRLTNGV